jgi:hypothetical protein
MQAAGKLSHKDRLTNKLAMVSCARIMINMYARITLLFVAFRGVSPEVYI